MKTLFLLSGWFLLLMSGCAGETENDADAQLIAARQAALQFGGEMKKALMEGLAAGGAPHALTVCKDLAPQIAQKVSSETGWELGRTSLRVRNPDNRPDAWERSVLAKFQADQEAGKDQAALEHHDVVTEDGRQVYRYMKAIPTGKLCLQCHGPEVATETKANIEELYPADQARDFNVGDIRGAFSLRRPL